MSKHGIPSYGCPVTFEHAPFTMRAEEINDEDGDYSYLGRLEDRRPDERHGFVDRFPHRGECTGSGVCGKGRYFVPEYTFEARFKDARRAGYARQPAFEKAREGVKQDADRFDKFHTGQLGFIGLRVTAVLDGTELGNASLWGIESDSDSGFLLDTMQELAAEAAKDGIQQLRKLCALRQKHFPFVKEGCDSPCI